MSLFGNHREHKGITRRHFAMGTAAATMAAIVLPGCADSGESTIEPTGEPQVVEDASQVVDVMEDYESKDQGIAAVATWSLPLGTVLFHSEGSWSAAMMAPESSAHPNTLGVLSLASGALLTLAEDPVTGSSYSFFDVRCGTGVFAWVEIDYTTLDWVLVAQPFADGALSGEPVRLDSGDADYEPPMFTVYGSTVIWLHMPQSTGSKSSEDSYCYRWTVGDEKGQVVWESTGRFATHPRVSDGILTIAPRVRNDEGTYYGMTAVDLENANHTQIDQLVLPAGVRPFDVVYTGEQFVFSIEASYNGAGSLGNMGTFIGREGGPYIYFGREPAAQAAFNGSRYLIKTQSAHYAVNTDDQSYGGISSPDRSLDYGDYPASEGQTTQFLTYATIRDAQGIPSSVTARVFAI